MSLTKLSSPSIYNPANQSAEEIISNFVVRLQEYEEVFTAIKNDKMGKPPQNFIIQGQRGYGKTTLLLRINHEIKNDPELNKWLIPVMFDEETYRVNTLAKLWEEVIDILESEKSFEGVSEKIDPLYDKESPEEEIFNLLIKTLKKQNKKLVLFLDNFGDMIGKFSKKEIQRLREVLNTCNYIRVIGASSLILEFYHSYKHPFYEFFKVITLDELTQEETIQLLKKLGETYKSEEIEKIITGQSERIESLRRLTGGVPRTIVLLYEIFADNVDGNSFRDLENILDKVTPLYKHRLDNLSKQQQTIIDAIAQNWDAISTKEIAKKIRMESKAVSSQLNQLEKNQLIVKESTSTKNHLYRINERFFNIYYLMRLGKRKNRNRVLWLVKFFEIWCGEKELTDRVQKHIEGLKQNKLYEKQAFYVTQALARTSIATELQHELLSAAKKYLTITKSPFVKDLDKSHIDIIKDVTECVKNERFDIAKKALKNDGYSDPEIYVIIGTVLQVDKKDFQKAKEYFLTAVEKGGSDAIFTLAVLYHDEFKDFKKAEEYYLMAVQKGNSDAMFNLALLYTNELKEFKKAEEYYLMAVQKGDSDAMFNLAMLYQDEFKNFKKAEEYYLMAFEKGLTGVMNNLAILYENELKDFKKAEKCYLVAVEKGNSNAMYNLALLYKDEYNDFKKAEEYYLMAVDKGESMAMYDLAILYENEFKDFKKAEEYYLMAVEKDDSEAMDNLALLYDNEFKDFEKAEKYHLLAAKKGNFNAMNNLAWLYYELKKDKLMALELQRKAFAELKKDYTAHTYLMILLWNDKIEEAIKLFNEYLNKENIFKEITKDIQNVFLMFLAKKQYHFIYKLFEENKFDIKDKYKPVYYATVKLLGEEYSDEFKKMPPELTETVDEILKEIEQMAIDYV